VFKGEVDRNQLPGAVIGVVRKGQLVYFESLGYRDPVAKDAMPANAIFAIASMTKPMVSIAIMMLHDEGKLLLSDPVGKFIPALAGMKVGVVKDGTVETVAAIRQPTVQDLLRHTAGFAYGNRGDTPVHKLWPMSSGTAGMTMTPQDFVAALSRRRCSTSPARCGTTAWRSTRSA
jgi:CubicO group peptidase (beta-lactamase class C family)